MKMGLVSIYYVKGCSLIFIRFSLKIFWNRRHKNFACLPEISFLLSVQFFSVYCQADPLLGNERRNFVIVFVFLFFYKRENLSSLMGFLFHFQRTKNCQLTFLKKLFSSNIEHKLHEKSDFINLPKY